MRAVAARFPRAQFVSVANAGHVTAFDSDCARELIVRFVETAAPVDASCAARFNPTYGVGEFARRAADAPAPPADRHDASTKLDRRVAGVAWAAAYDAHPAHVPDGRRARRRAARRHVHRAATELAFDRVRFAADVAVSGQRAPRLAARSWPNSTSTAPGARTARCASAGRVFPHTSLLTARGVIGGRRVAVLVPSA